MKKTVKKAVGVLLAAVMTAGMLAGCGGSGKESGQAAEAGSGTPKSNVTLTFGSHQSGLPTSGIVHDMAREFEAETGIKIDFQISPDAQWRDLIKVKLDSGEAPDIICVDTPIDLASGTKMDRYCVELGDQEWVSRMDDSARSAVSADGKLYGITFPGAKMYFYLYNKEIFAAQGLEVPTNYEEFKVVCQKLQDAGITPIYEATTNGWHQVLPLFETGGLWLAQDPDIYNKLNNNEIDLDQIPALLTIIRQLDECAKAGYYGTDYLSNAWEGAKEAMATGRCAMTIGELGFRGDVEKDYPEFTKDKLGAFVMPWGDNQMIGVNPASNAYFINKESKHVEEAKQFFAFLARHENLQKLQDGWLDISDLCWAEITSKYSEEDQKFIDSLAKANVVQTSVNYIDSQWMDVGKDLESMYTGASTPEDVLATIMKRRNEQAQLQKDPAWVK